MDCLFDFKKIASSFKNYSSSKTLSLLYKKDIKSLFIPTKMSLWQKGIGSKNVISGKIYPQWDV